MAKINVSNQLSVNAHLKPDTDNGFALGTTDNKWADLFMASGAVLNFNSGDVTMTHSSNLLTISGGSTRVDKLELSDASNYIELDTDLKIIAANDVVITGDLLPSADDTYDLGSAAAAWQDLFLEGDITMSDAGTFSSSAGAITIDGASGVLIQGNSSEVDITTTGALDLNGGAITVDGTSISMDAVQASNFTVAGANLTLATTSSGNLVASAAGNVDVDGSAVSIDATGALSMQGAAASDFTMAASSSSEVKMTIAASNSGSGAGVIDMDADGAITVDAGAGLSLDAGAASNLSTSAGDLTLDAAAGSLNLTGGEADAAAVRIQADNAAGGIDVDAGTGGIAVDTTGALSLDAVTAANLTLEGGSGSGADVALVLKASNQASSYKGNIDMDADGEIFVDAGEGISVDAAAASNFSTSAGDLTLDAAAGSLNLTGGEADAAAVKIQADNAAGGIDIDAGSAGIDMATTGVLSIDSADTTNLTMTANASGDKTMSIIASNSGSGSGLLSITADTVTINGNLDVEGTTTTIDTTSLAIEDHNIVLDRDNGTSAVVDGCGFTMEGGSGDDITIQQLASGDRIEIKKGSSYHTLAVGKLSLDGTSGDYLELDTDVKLFATADILLDPAGGEVKVDGNVVPNSDSADSLGASGTAWANLYVDAIDLNGQGSISMGGTGRIDLDADDDTSIRASADDVITFEVGGTDEFQMDSSMFGPSSADGAALGGASNEWSDLFLADGAVINFGNDQDVTMTLVEDSSVSLGSDIKSSHIGNIDDLTLTESTSAITFASLGSDLKSSTGLQLGNTSFSSSTSALEFIELGSDISSSHAGNIVGSFLGTSTSSISFSSESAAASFDSALNSARRMRFDDGSNIVDFVFSSYSSGTSISVSSATGISGESVSSLSVSGLSGSGTIKPIEGSSTNAAAFNSSNPGATLRFETGSASLDISLSSYSSGTSIGVSSVTVRSGSSIAIGALVGGGSSSFLKVKSGNDSAASSFSTAVQGSGSGGIVEFSDGSSVYRFTLGSYGSGQSTVSVSSVSKVSGGSTLYVSNVSSSGHIKVVTTSVSHSLDVTDSFDLTQHDGSSVGLYLAGTHMAASAAELNAVADVSAGADHVAAVDVSADHFIFRDGGNTGASKIESFVDLAAAMAGDGLDAASGQFKISHMTDIASSASRNSILSADLATASLSSTPMVLAATNITASVAVYVNGLLQTPSGAVETNVNFSAEGDDHQAAYDYELHVDNGTYEVQLVDALDYDDVIQIRYFKA